MNKTLVEQYNLDQTAYDKQLIDEHVKGGGLLRTYSDKITVDQLKADGGGLQGVGFRLSEKRIGNVIK